MLHLSITSRNEAKSPDLKDLKHNTKPKRCSPVQTLSAFLALPLRCPRRPRRKRALLRRTRQFGTTNTCKACPATEAGPGVSGRVFTTIPTHGAATMTQEGCVGATSPLFAGQRRRKRPGSSCTTTNMENGPTSTASPGWIGTRQRARLQRTRRQTTRRGRQTRTTSRLGLMTAVPTVTFN